MSDLPSSGYLACKLSLCNHQENDTVAESTVNDTYGSIQLSTAIEGIVYKKK